MAALCAECAEQPAEPHRYFCFRCVTAYIAGIRRRREAECRLPVLDQVSE